jgi:hypothetical protein
MPTSTVKTTGYVSGEDSDTIEANRVYQDALARLAQSLDTRKNRFFDPVWLAAAQGFLAPTQTGGFGEALGNAAKSISAAQDQDIKEQQAIDEQRVAAAGKGVELQRMRAKDSEFAKYFASKQAIAGPQAGALAGPNARPTANATEPSVGALPAPTGDSLFSGGKLKPEELAIFKAGNAGLPTGRLSPEELAQFQAIPKADKLTVPEAPVAARGVSAGQPGALPAPAPVQQAPQGALPVASDSEDDGGVQIMPKNPNLLTGDEYIMRNRYSGKSLGELLKEAAEIERKYLEVQVSGTTNLRTGKFYASDPTPVEVKIFAEGYNGGTYTIPKSVALQLSIYQRQGKDAEYKALIDRFTGRTSGRPAGSPPVAGGAVPVVRAPASVGSGSNEDRALAAARTKALAEADTAIEVENRKDFATRGKDSSEMLATANVMRSFTADPNFKKMTGILSNNNISSGIAQLVRDGIGGKNFTIGIPAIEDVMRNAKLTTEEQATFRTFLMYATQMQLNAEKAMKGATSQPERLILGSANISPQDTAEAVRRKADLLTTKGQFDRQAARAFKASKMTAEEFLDSDQYMGMYDKYFADISGIATGLKAYQNPAAAAPAGTQPTGTPASGAPPVSASIKAARDRVRKELEKP